MVKICTYVDKRTDFIRIQARAFKTFFKDDYEYIVFNNASDESPGGMRDQITNVCQEQGVRCIRVQNRNHNTANEAHAAALNWSYREVILKEAIPDYLFIVDFDTVLLRDFSVAKYLEGYDITGIWQGRGTPEHEIKYLWPGMLMLNMKTLPNKETIDLYCGHVDGIGVDVGGQLAVYLRNNPTVKVKSLSDTGQFTIEGAKQHLPAKILERYVDDYKWSLMANAIIHYGAGSNWNHRPASFHTQKTACYEFFLEQCIADRSMFNPTVE